MYPTKLPVSMRLRMIASDATLPACENSRTRSLAPLPAAGALTMAMMVQPLPLVVSQFKGVLPRSM